MASTFPGGPSPQLVSFVFLDFTVLESDVRRELPVRRSVLTRATVGVSGAPKVEF